jgi:hypothetical protein
MCPTKVRTSHSVQGVGAPHWSGRIAATRPSAIDKLDSSWVADGAVIEVLLSGRRGGEIPVRGEGEIRNLTGALAGGAFGGDTSRVQRFIMLSR